ncbi:MAG TPA: hypothetical protein VFY84_18530 [Jiangellales bacterium]|nr:hypothetical protein [Jiangellales bacterium]
MRGRSVVPTQRNRVVGALSAMVVAVALIDVIIAGAWDTVVVLGFALLLQLMLVVSLHAPRPTVSLRGDLYRWLDERASATGEPIEHITDRCIAAYRANLTVDADEPGRSGP